MTAPHDPGQTPDKVPPTNPRDAGRTTAFGDGFGPPAAGSVLHALGGSLPEIPQVHLRDPAEGPVTPVLAPESPPRPPDDPAGQPPAGRLQLLGEIARGGMGAILRGR